MDAIPAAEDIHGYYFEDLSVGMTASYAKTVTETDIVLFAGILDDVNPEKKQVFAHTLCRVRDTPGV